MNTQDFDKSVLESRLRNSKITTLNILKKLVDSPILTTRNISTATTYSGEDLRGQMGTISRMGLAIKAGVDEQGDPRWKLNPEIDKKWLGSILTEFELDKT